MLTSNKTVRYKHWKNEAENEQDGEILITSPSNGEQGSSLGKGKTYPHLKISCKKISISIITVIFFVILGASYYYNNILQCNHSEAENNSDIICVPLQKVTKLVLETEITDYNSCSDNETCHTFLDVIEQQHDGLKYNFVIGARGELYIGSGFKCLVNRDESSLYVKLLKLEESSFQGYFKTCLRLSEIIDHGILCEKMSQHYKTQIKYEHNNDSINVDDRPICTNLASDKQRPYHVHDPGNQMRKLVHPDFGWTFCGNFSSTMNITKGRVITVESLPRHSCSPLQLVDKITVDVIETPPFSCSDDSSCLHTFEQNHDGFKYNFIIGHDHDLYVGLGFKCKAENTSGSMMKIKVLITPGSEIIHGWNLIFERHKLLQIIDEGVACGKVSSKYSVEAICNITGTEQDVIEVCRFTYEEMLSSDNLVLGFLDNSETRYNISTEHGRGIVPSTYSYQFCSRKQSSLESNSYEYDEMLTDDIEM